MKQILQLPIFLTTAIKTTYFSVSCATVASTSTEYFLAWNWERWTWSCLRGFCVEGILKGVHVVLFVCAYGVVFKLCSNCSVWNTVVSQRAIVIFTSVVSNLQLTILFHLKPHYYITHSKRHLHIVVLSTLTSLLSKYVSTRYTTPAPSPPSLPNSDPTLLCALISSCLYTQQFHLAQRTRYCLQSFSVSTCNLRSLIVISIKFEVFRVLTLCVRKRVHGSWYMGIGVKRLWFMISRYRSGIWEYCRFDLPYLSTFSIFALRIEEQRDTWSKPRTFGQIFLV